MTVDQESLGIADPRHRKSGGTVVGMHPMQQASMRIADFRDGRSLLKAKDLVGLLLCHGARAWRASQPVAHCRIMAKSPSGHSAIHLRFR